MGVASAGGAKRGTYGGGAKREAIAPQRESKLTTANLSSFVLFDFALNEPSGPAIFGSGWDAVQRMRFTYCRDVRGFGVLGS
jgi:hypothetical protein